MLHSTAEWTIRQPAGLEGPADLHIGLQLARRGYVAMCPRCFLWEYRRAGKLETAVDWLHARHPGVTGMAKMLYDATRAVDLLAAIEDVDAHRIGAIGHSLGAKEVLYLAAFDERIRRGRLERGRHRPDVFELGRALVSRRRRSAGPDFSLDHGQILALAAPRAFLLIGGDSADGDRSWPYIAEALPVWKLTGAAGRRGPVQPPPRTCIPAAEARSEAEAWLDWFLRTPDA